MKIIKLRELRKAKGYTLKELGDIIGVAESTMSHYETGKRSPDFETLLKFGELFNVTVDYLLTGEESHQNKKAPSAFEGLDPETDRAYFSVMSDLKRDGISPHDLRVIAETYKAAKRWEEEVKDKKEK